MFGTDAVLTQPSDTEPFEIDHRHLYHGRALAVLLPRDGQSPRSLDAPGKIIVVDGTGKLLRTIAVPSVSMPNLAFGPDEKVIYVMALDQIDKAPWHGKVYEVPNQ